MPLSETPEVFYHDVFNMIVLTFINLSNIVYLSFATDLNLIGTPFLGEKYRNLFSIFYYSFISYLIVDTVWISTIPKTLSGSPLPFVFHHIIVLVLCSVPYFEPQFDWLMALSLLVEIHPLILTIKRYVPREGHLYKCLDALFYVTWVLMRIIGFPILFCYYVVEYQRYSASKGTYLNIILLGPIILGVVTILNYKWSYDMVCNTSKGEDKAAESPEVVKVDVESSFVINIVE